MDNQLEIGLAASEVAAAVPSGGAHGGGLQAGANDLLAFANVGEKIRATMGKLEKVELLKNYFLTLRGTETARGRGGLHRTAVSGGGIAGAELRVGDYQGRAAGGIGGE